MAKYIESMIDQLVYFGANFSIYEDGVLECIGTEKISMVYTV
jgi:hypothetical protein